VVLKDLAILLKNVYNINEIKVILYMLSFIKVLISQDDPRDYKGAGVKRIIVTIIKCISVNSKSLLLIII
jgi:hypothetical protein